MWVIPSWAIGVAFLIVITGTVQVIVRRLTGRAGGGQSTDVPEALEGVQRRLGELEERVDFAERLLAQERGEGRLAPPKRAP